VASAFLFLHPGPDPLVVTIHLRQKTAKIAEIRKKYGEKLACYLLTYFGAVDGKSGQLADILGVVMPRVHSLFGVLAMDVLSLPHALSGRVA